MAPHIKARIAASAFVAAMLLAPGAPARAAGPDAGPVNVERLKQTYLACEQTAATRRLSAAEVAVCSQVAAQTLRRVFGGDLDDLVAWWHASRQRVAATAP